MKRTSIINLPITISFIAVILVSLFGLFSSIKGYRDFLSEYQEIEEAEIEERKGELKADIQRLLAVIHSVKSQTEERLRQNIQSRVYEAVNTANHLYESYKERLSPAEIRELIRESLRKIRFQNGRGYYFANRINDGYEILCATCEYLENHILMDLEDKKGQYVIRDMIQIIKEKGEGFYTYHWTKPHEEGVYPKIAYVKLFEPFGWFIGTGDYLDDVEKDIQKEVIRTVQRMDLGKNKYIFIVNSDGITLAHGDRDIIGKRLPSLIEEGGENILRLFQGATQKPDGDYVKYDWVRTGERTATEKLSYVTLVPEWQWIVGTGFHHEEIFQGLQGKREALKAEIGRQVVFYSIFLFGGIVLVLLMGRYYRERIRSDAESLVNFLRRAAQTDRLENNDALKVDSFRFREFATVSEYSRWLVKERIAKEKALREGEAMLKRVFQAAPICIGMAQNRIIEWTNKKITDITGYSRDELQNRNMRILYVDDEEFERVGCVQVPLMADPGVATIETVWKRKDGQIRNILISLSNIVSGDLSSGIIFTALDITDRKAAEEALQQSQRIDAIGTLAGGIAHDFNNILGIIVGNSDLAELDIPKENPARQYIAEIRKACLRASDMVRQILTFSRKSKHEMKPIRISTIIGDSLKLLRASIPTTIEIRQSISGDIAPVLGDATQINQVLINLCTNASHAMEKNGGILDVRLENVEMDEKDAAEIHELRPGKYVLLTVQDTGQGIAPEIMNKIFDPYFTTKGVGEGSGMGLAVVHGIVNSHHGVITVASSERHGTTFKIYFPSYSGEMGPEPMTSQTLRKGKGHILIVDDEEAIVEIERMMLEHLGYSVEAMTSSVEALETFRKNPYQFDLVITDQTMPRMTGKKLAEKMVSLRGDIPIILCTGYSDMINEDRSGETGIRGYASKPLVMSELARIVGRALDREVSRNGAA